MTQTFRIRARRFHALYELLTGETHPEARVDFVTSDHLKADVGLKDVARPIRSRGPIRLFPIDLHKF